MTGVIDVGNLQRVSSLTGNEDVPMQQGNQLVKATSAAIAALAGGALPAGGNVGQVVTNIGPGAGDWQDSTGGSPYVYLSGSNVVLAPTGANPGFGLSIHAEGGSADAADNAQARGGNITLIAGQGGDISGNYSVSYGGSIAITSGASGSSPSGAYNQAFSGDVTIRSGDASPSGTGYNAYTGNITLQGGDASAAPYAYGGNLVFRAGGGYGNQHGYGEGGNITITGGVGKSFQGSGHGGNVTLTGGYGQTVSGSVAIIGGYSTGGSPGNVTIATHNAAAGYDGSPITITAGSYGGGMADGGDVNINAGGGGGDAGLITLIAGAGVGDGNGGKVTLYAGAGSGTGYGGVIQIYAGQAQDDGPGGLISIKPGFSVHGAGGNLFLYSGGSYDGTAGNITISVPASGVGHDGSPIAITAGNAGAGDYDGGDIVLTLGTNTGTGTPGQFFINNLPASDPGIPGAWWADGVTHVVQISP